MPTTLSDKTGPFGRSVPLVAAIKQSVNQSGFTTPIVATGGITTFEQAEAILQSGDADMIGMGASLCPILFVCKVRMVAAMNCAVALQ